MTLNQHNAALRRQLLCLNDLAFYSSHNQTYKQHTVVSLIFSFFFQFGFNQPIANVDSGTCVDDPCSPITPVSALSHSNAAITNLDTLTLSQTLPSPKKKDPSVPKRSITFATLPKPLRSTSTEFTAPPILKNRPPSSIMKERPASMYEKSPYAPASDLFNKKYILDPIKTTQPRFRLPPTPLTNPQCTEERLGTSTFSNKRQIARSVDGKFLVEVGDTSACLTKS